MYTGDRVIVIEEDSDYYLQEGCILYRYPGGMIYMVDIDGQFGCHFHAAELEKTERLKIPSIKCRVWDK